MSKLINYRKTVQEVLIGLGMVTIGALLARLHLHAFDRMFLAQGRLSRLIAKRAQSHGEARGDLDQTAC